MVAAHHHPLKRTFMVDDHPDQDPYSDKCEYERNRSDEHSLPGPIGNSAADQEAKPRELQENEQHDHNQAGECQ